MEWLRKTWVLCYTYRPRLVVTILLAGIILALAACTSAESGNAVTTHASGLEEDLPEARSVETEASPIAPLPTRTRTPAPTRQPGRTPTATLPPTPQSDPVLVGAGDIAWCSRGGRDEQTAALLDNIPGTVFTAGDVVYDSGSHEEFAECYEPGWGRHKDRTRPAVGDHEYRTEGAAGYFDYFGAAAGEAGKGWYSYDLGEWHIIVLNSNCGEVGGCDAGSEQGQWLKADLEANPAQCTLAYWHHPLFSMRDAQESENRYFWPVMYEHGVEVIVNGNDHHYVRFTPQTPDGTADPERGVRQFTVGTGGRNLYPFSYQVPNVEASQSSVHGVLKLTLRAGSYEWEFISIDGSYSDSGGTDCH